MWWFVIICVIVLLTCHVTKRDKAAKAKFNAQHPNGISGLDLSREAQEFLRNGQRIRAIKQLRKDTGLGLKDAKEILDTITI